MQGQIKILGQTTVMLFAAALLSFGNTQMPVQQQPGSMPPPGAVNYVEGQVSLEGQQLTPQSVKSTIIQPGQAIDTGNGYAEILLTPGAFLRIGHDSEVRLESGGLANTKLDVVRGSAMIEAAEFVKGTDMEVTVSGATATIQKNGLYDFSATGQYVRVLDGKLKIVQGSQETTLSKGDQVLLASDKPLKKRDFDQKSAKADSLYVWSAVRSNTEAQANVNEASEIATYGGWYGPGWYWDPFWGSYAFLPGYGFIGSPFGWGFYSPAYVYAAPLYWGRYGWRGNYAYAHGYHGTPSGFHGMSGAHAVGGMHAMGGGFGGGGFHGGGGGRR
jgi:FecR protein